MPHTEFRTSFTQPEGLGRTDVFTGRVIDVDEVNWTVDVVSQFDQMRVFNIPVGSPYQHSARGEGMFVMPEVGSKCVVCWPGDSAPPFLLAFVMPHETVPGEEEGAASASYAGGRSRAKQGDIFLRGRDGNFVTLHRGGVLQIGSTELAQRLYIPINNLVMDFAENYEMHTAGGSIRWGVQDGEGEDNLPTQSTQTFRVYANDKKADVRVAMGRVRRPVTETDGDARVDQGVLGVGAEEPIVCEMTLAPNGFNAEKGEPDEKTPALVRLRFLFDRAGNGFLRVDGNLGVLCKKKLRLRAKEDMEIFADSAFLLNVKGAAKVSAGGTLELSGKVVRVNGGTSPVAKVGSTVSVNLPPNILIASPTSPTGFAPIVSVPTLLNAAGTVTSGSADVLVP